ncbi:hypothetical protein ES703_123314 [subsurface metagenome]
MDKTRFITQALGYGTKEGGHIVASFFENLLHALKIKAS